MNIEAFHSQRAKNIYEISNWFVQWFLKTTQSCHQKKKNQPRDHWNPPPLRAGT